MKCWTFLALLVTVSAVLLGVGNTETTSLDDFEDEQSFIDTENDIQINADASVNGKDENDDNDSKQSLDSVDETPSNDEDETKMFKRTPGRRRRRRFRIRIRGRRIKERVRKLHKGLKKVCKVVEPVLPTGPVKTVCRWVRILGDEEFPLKNDETFIPAEEADEEETSWLEEQQSD